MTYSDKNNDGVLNLADGDIKQINSYYPFGLNMEGNFNGASGTNKYQYNGKEWNDDFGLGLNDYGARFYDPAIGRWNSVDPESESNGQASFSVYHYVFDNPIKHTDPNGKQANDIVITGANNSSVTIKTDVIDISVNASSLGLDFGGNYSISGKEVLQAGLDIVGIFDPTGIADGINASISAKSGDLKGAAISAVGLIPFAGDLAKVGKIEKDVNVIKESVDALTKAEQRAAKLSQVSREGKDFTKAGKEAVLDVNKAKNGGAMKCEKCATEMLPAKQSKSGVTPPKNEAAVDHVKAKSKGGSGTPDNGQGLCRECNGKKSDN